jgi:hypothetical protein
VPPWQNRPADSPRLGVLTRISGGYVVRDANGQALAYLYSRETEADARQAKALTNDEARRIAINVARLPGLLGKADRDYRDGRLPSVAVPMPRGWL